MREIKFRAWDGKEMVKPCNLWDRENNPIGWLNNLPYPDSILMQYTGLKDKNGKEIYEGDICRHASGRPEVNSVEYYYGEWHLEPHGLHLSDEYEQVEVIGSIYENPELLK